MPIKKDPTDRASTPSGRQQVNFRIDGELLERIDSTAESVGVSRSELFLRAASIICDRPDLLSDAARSNESHSLDDKLDKRLAVIEESIPTLIKQGINQVLDITLDTRLDQIEERILGKYAA